MLKNILPVRTFTKTQIDADCQDLHGKHENELFFNCTFKKLNGLTLKDCVLTQSKFLTDDIEDALGFTMTLDCMSFKDVEFSELLFDLFLTLAIMSKGNTAKRQKLVEIVGKDRVRAILAILANLEPKRCN